MRHIIKFCFVFYVFLIPACCFIPIEGRGGSYSFSLGVEVGDSMTWNIKEFTNDGSWLLPINRDIVVSKGDNLTITLIRVQENVPSANHTSLEFLSSLNGKDLDGFRQSYNIYNVSYCIYWCLLPVERVLLEEVRFLELHGYTASLINNTLAAAGDDTEYILTYDNETGWLTYLKIIYSGDILIELESIDMHIGSEQNPKIIGNSDLIILPLVGLNICLGLLLLLSYLLFQEKRKGII